MTAFDFSLVKNTSFAFNATADSLNLGAVSAASLGVRSSGGNLILTIGSDSVTLTGTTVEQVTTSNITFGTAVTRSAWAVGDNATGSTFDANGNTIDIDGSPAAPFTTGYTLDQANANHLVHGLGGGDTILVGNGDNLIYGGSGAADSTDGNDNITVGTGGNTIYGNAGNDQVVLGVTVAGKTNNVFLGLGNDTLNIGGGAMAGNLVLYGNSGEDDITLSTAASSSAVTVFGGNGTGDTTDGADTIRLGTGDSTAYGNAGNDTINFAALGDNKRATIYAGLDNDSVTASFAGSTSSTTILFGNSGNDTINNGAFAGKATIYGGNGESDSTDGNDVITVGIGSTIVYGNAGNDSISITGDFGSTVGGDTVIVHTGAGNDTVVATSAGNGQDDDMDMAFYSNAGNDTFILNNNGTAAVEYDFTIGDFATGDVVQYTVDGASATTSATQLSVSGGGSSLVIDDSSGGSITFQGYGGDLNATNFQLNNSNLLITNFTGTAATLTGGANNDQLVSGSSADVLISGGGTDKLVGNAGNDTFQFTATQAEALSTAGTVTGGDGTDILEITGATAVTLQDADFTANVTSIETVKVANVASNSVTLNTLAETAGVRLVDASALTGTNALTLTLDTDWDTTVSVTGGVAADTITSNNQAGSWNASISGGAGADQITLQHGTFGSGDTISGGADTDRLTLGNAAGSAYAVTDSMFANVTSVEQLYLANSGAAGAVTLGTAAQAAGITLVDNSLETGHTLNFNASTYTAALTVNLGDGDDSVVAGSGGITVRVDAFGDSANNNDQITLGGGTDTIQMEIAERNADSDFTDSQVVDINSFTFGTDVFDLTDLATGTLRGGGNNIVVANGTTTGFSAATDSLFVATNTFAGATIANVATGMSFANGLADAAIIYLLFSDGANGYLARITGAGGANLTAADDVQFLAEFVGQTSFAAVTEAQIDASFADWIA